MRGVEEDVGAILGNGLFIARSSMASRNRKTMFLMDW
jgi:hypothetical protein